MGNPKDYPRIDYDVIKRIIERDPLFLTSPALIQRQYQRETGYKVNRASIQHFIRLRGVETAVKGGNWDTYSEEKYLEHCKRFGIYRPEDKKWLTGESPES